MFGLETGIFILLSLCLLAACAFEFINGFHDTANAVATVIYTNSLKPSQAVIWSGIWNFIGLLASVYLFAGLGVAMKIVNLLPVELLIDQNVYHAIAMILALLFSAIIWNFGTWYFGLPSSSSHTLIGSILGVGLGYSLLPENKTGSIAVNWAEAQKIFSSLLISPLLGFSLAVVIMFILRRVLSKNIRKQVFSEPEKDAPPPLWIRAILILTCTLVSFFHGNNDGQKGVGLVMLILIGILPSYFAIHKTEDLGAFKQNLTVIEQKMAKVDTAGFSTVDIARVKTVKDNVAKLNGMIGVNNAVDKEKSLDVRKSILLIKSNVSKLIEGGSLTLNEKDIKELKDNLGEKKGLAAMTDFAPAWVLLMISLSLGLGTMIGWKRIVVTVGEKIGKNHLTYAQGASAELVAASTIGIASSLNLPVSTTHVLSSGIAGTMVANKGIKNLQAGTIKNILLAWLLTLPVSIILSATLFVLFRWIF